MKFYEGKNQFIIIDEGEITPNNEPILTFNIFYDFNRMTYIEFPEFDLALYSKGQYVYTYWAFMFRGVSFIPKNDGKWESVVINTLNKIKVSKNKEKAICDIIKESMTDEEFKMIEKIINQKNVRAEYLEKKIKDLEEKNAELKLAEGLRDENEKLRDKLDKIQAILKND